MKSVACVRKVRVIVIWPLLLVCFSLAGDETVDGNYSRALNNHEIIVNQQPDPKSRKRLQSLIKAVRILARLEQAGKSRSEIKQQWLVAALAENAEYFSRSSAIRLHSENVDGNRIFIGVQAHKDKFLLLDFWYDPASRRITKFDSELRVSSGIRNIKPDELEVLSDSGEPTLKWSRQEMSAGMALWKASRASEGDLRKSIDFLNTLFTGKKAGQSGGESFARFQINEMVCVVNSRSPDGKGEVGPYLRKTPGWEELQLVQIEAGEKVKIVGVEAVDSGIWYKFDRVGGVLVTGFLSEQSVKECE